MRFHFVIFTFKNSGNSSRLTAKEIWRLGEWVEQQKTSGNEWPHSAVCLCAEACIRLETEKLDYLKWIFNNFSFSLKITKTFDLVRYTHPFVVIVTKLLIGCQETGILCILYATSYHIFSFSLQLCCTLVCISRHEV